MTEMPPYLSGKDEEKDSGEEESDSSDVDDWVLPLSYDQQRHLEPIKGLERAEHSWRVKEKVRRPAIRICVDHNKRTWTPLHQPAPQCSDMFNSKFVQSLKY